MNRKQLLKHRNAVLQKMQSIREHASTALVIHYSCESFDDISGGRTPRITSIAVQRLACDQTTSFSFHQIAEKEGIQTDVIEQHYDRLEKTMLERFFAFVEKHQDCTWIHWKMRDANFGFEALEHRFAVHGGKSPAIANDKKFDLSKALSDLYGKDYIECPRMESLMRKNDLIDEFFLPGKDEAKAFEKKEFVKMHQSTLKKVDGLAKIFDRALNGELITNSTPEDNGVFKDEGKSEPIRISRIAIRNYKGIDDFSMDFPTPRLAGDPDILVMGSQNGLGKTSVLECCTLLLLAVVIQKDRFMLRDQSLRMDIPDLLIKAGAEVAEIEGDVVMSETSLSVQLRIGHDGGVSVSSEPSFEEILEDALLDSESTADALVKAISGFSPDPVIADRFLLFHSYRKVQEGSPELGMMVDRGRSRQRNLFSRYEMPMSAFKLLILRSMMSKAKLFELEESIKQDESIEMLNELVQLYAGGVISHLRPSPDNTVDIMVKPTNGGKSFTFDGLSSGQKEIISTLFLVWYHTKNNPSVVFIDEPELHLNVQWHRSFVRKLVTMAPHNQYIMATHSEDVMDSVSEDRRILLLNSSEGE
ncbi:MAG: ATP-binding protein [Proteobacteria bacterium]|nr:ATP-binding protein [Pseudomonadota bacterium]